MLIPGNSIARSRQRACLQEGLRLDLNRLARSGFVSRGCKNGPKAIQWTNTYTGEIIAAALLTADLRDPATGSFRIQIGKSQQVFDLAFCPRHFGGGQWYFICPRTGRLCSAVWRPPGALYFASRQTWGRQVAYSSQFQTRTDRAYRAARAIRMRLGGSEWESIDECDPPKPKWMRWNTYERLIDRSRAYEAIGDEGTFGVIARLMARYGDGS